jgi:hypothetical protein
MYADFKQILNVRPIDCGPADILLTLGPQPNSAQNQNRNKGSTYLLVLAPITGASRIMEHYGYELFGPRITLPSSAR